MPKTSFPAAVVVSMAAPCPVSTFSPIPPGEVVDGVDQVVQVASEPVEFPHHQRVVRAQRLETRGQAGAVVGASGGVVGFGGFKTAATSAT
jgi:hypothetical protein